MTAIPELCTLSTYISVLAKFEFHDRTGLEIAACHWPKAGQILEMVRDKIAGDIFQVCFTLLAYLIVNGSIFGSSK